MNDFEKDLYIAENIAKDACKLGGRAYFVGGYVRDALLGIDRHGAGFLALGDCALRADLHAHRRCAVVAGEGHVVGEHVVLPQAALVAPGAARVLVHVAEADLGGQVVLILAGHGAGLAARAPGAVEVETVLGHFSFLLVGTKPA